jgi:hypothetical protein
MLRHGLGVWLARTLARVLGLTLLGLPLSLLLKFRFGREACACLHGRNRVLATFRLFPLEPNHAQCENSQIFSGDLSNSGLAVRGYSEGGQLARLMTLLGGDSAAISGFYLPAGKL